MTQGHILSRLPLYAVALIAFSLLHTSWNWATRAILFPIAGLGVYHYGAMPLPYLMEFPVDVLIFTLMVVAIHISLRLERGRRRQVDAAQLEANLARAELDNLRLRLQPHFLFNALNTVSAVMYDDPRRADEVLDRLGELLRASLEQDRIDEVSLAEELGILDAYLAITRARFGDRLIVEVAVPVELQSARVLPLLLQPLVENAVRHGRAERDGHGRIRVSARSDGGRLLLEVWDDGDGSPTGVGGSGLGLEATRERLRLLHREDAAMVTGPAEDGGFAVTLQLPLRFIEEGA
jgi:two-component system LytT family sensor kinase